jgi:hypothetical protein
MHCSNKLCLQTIGAEKPGWYCPLCDRRLCSDCVDIQSSSDKEHNGNHVARCCFCGRVCDPIELSNESSDSSGNLHATITRRLAMGKNGLDQTWGICIHCGFRTYVDSLSSLRTVQCSRCGTTYFQGLDGNTYVGENESFKPEFPEFNPLQGFFDKFQNVFQEANADSVGGRVQMKNWVLSQAQPIRAFNMVEGLRASNMGQIADYVDDVLKKST